MLEHPLSLPPLPPTSRKSVRYFFFFFLFFINRILKMKSKICESHLQPVMAPSSSSSCLLYPEMAPHTATLPPKAMWGITDAVKLPPTLGEEKNNLCKNRKRVIRLGDLLLCLDQGSLNFLDYRSLYLYRSLIFLSTTGQVPKIIISNNEVDV